MTWQGRFFEFEQFRFLIFDFVENQKTKMELNEMELSVERERVTHLDEESGIHEPSRNILTERSLLIVVLAVFAIFFGAVVVYFLLDSSSSEEEGAWEGAPVWTKDIVFHRDEFQHCFVDDISDVPHLVLCWTVEGKELDEIRFGVGGFCNHKGGEEGHEPYLGLGISANGGMFGADIVTFSEKLDLQDRFSSSFSLPRVDEIQNVELKKSLLQNGVLSFVFTRKLMACEDDKADVVTGKGADLDILNDGQFTNVIWAIGEVQGDDISFHNMMRGSLELDLFSGGKPPAHDIRNPPGKNPEVEGEFEVVMNDGNGDPLSLEEVVSGTDTYLCITSKIPNFKSKKHLIEIDSIVNSTEYVHHMLLYLCEGTPPEDSFQPNSCNMGSCQAVITGWAVGSFSSYNFPENVGFPFGEDGEQQYVQLQIHYNTPTKPKNVLDGSGFRFRYADPRPIDSGMMTFGWHTDSYFQIPKGERIGSSNATFESYFPSQCLTDAMEDGGVENITIFHGVLHMHKYGKKSHLQHYREDQELPLVGYSEYYDFNYQRFQIPTTVVLPGDTLKMVCMYDTVDAPATVYGGEGTENEMCIYFFSYYPRIKMFDHPGVTMKQDENGQSLYCNGKWGENDTVRVNYVDYENVVPLSQPDRHEC